MSFINSIRILVALIGFIGALVAPAWLPMLCIVLLALRFSAVEAIALGFFMDMLWLPAGFPHALPLYTMASIIIVWGLEPLRLEFLRS